MDLLILTAVSAGSYSNVVLFPCMTGYLWQLAGHCPWKIICGGRGIRYGRGRGMPSSRVDSHWHCQVLPIQPTTNQVQSMTFLNWFMLWVCNFPHLVNFKKKKKKIEPCPQKNYTRIAKNGSKSLEFVVVEEDSPKLKSAPVFLYFICGLLPQHGWQVV